MNAFGSKEAGSISVSPIKFSRRPSETTTPCKVIIILEIFSTGRTNLCEYILNAIRQPIDKVFLITLNPPTPSIVMVNSADKKFKTPAFFACTIFISLVQFSDSFILLSCFLKKYDCPLLNMQENVFETIVSSISA